MLALGLVSLALADTSGDTVPTKDTWDLTQLYASPDAWEQDMTKLAAAVASLEDCRGKVATQLESCLGRRFDAPRGVARAAAYATNASNADTRDDAWRGRSQRATMLQNDLVAATAFFRPEIIAMGDAQVKDAIAKDAKLAPYAYYLTSTVRDAPHVLDPGREKLLADTADLREAPDALYTVLSNAELPWPTVDLHGKPVTLDAAAYTLYRGDNDRAVRKQVFDAFFGEMSKFSGTFATALDAAVRGHWFVAETRGYPSSMAAAVDGDHLPPAIYDRLIERTNANLPTLHRYLKLRAQLLGVTDLSYYDLYPPIVSSDKTYTIDEAEALTLAATAPLGADYTAMLKTGFGSRWMDAYPHPGKDSGAYMDGQAYDVHPLVLLNFTGDYESVSTLAHEWGHAGHSVLSTKAQPYPTADYATFIAEIASTFNEALLVDYMVKHAKTDDEKLMYLGSALEGLRTTYFRQAQLAEFELAVHQQVEKGQPLTGDGCSATYLDILKRYYGHDQGVTHIDDAYAIEWAYIPHFYWNFYVYQYATSIAASSLLADDVIAGKKGAVDRYLTLLKAGGSDDPYVLLKNAGVDMASPAPYDAIAKRMNSLMDQIEAIEAKKAKAKR